jgi:uncharacterized membrane protein
MNAVQVHLMLNHVPVLAPVLAAAFVVIGRIFRSQPVLRVALALLPLAALLAIPLYLTGEPAEEMVEHYPGVAEQETDRHESAALVSLVLLVALGVVAATALWIFRRRPVPGGWSATVLIACLAVGAQVAWTAHLGGLIRHPELQGAPAARTNPQSETQGGGEKDDDD